jgi:hypothetical protein
MQLEDMFDDFNCWDSRSEWQLQFLSYVEEASLKLLQEEAVMEGEVPVELSQKICIIFSSSAFINLCAAVNMDVNHKIAFIIRVCAHISDLCRYLDRSNATSCVQSLKRLPFPKKHSCLLQDKIIPYKY